MNVKLTYHFHNLSVKTGTKRKQIISTYKKSKFCKKKISKTLALDYSNNTKSEKPSNEYVCTELCSF